ncbi:hypothetical protein [Brevibacillus porteri]|uniref:hypothetical protein n=1 Tax=Brevibacillus porteri TaxID=2126350 RepID=UPI003625EFBC
MSGERVDSVEKYYKPVKYIDSLSNGLLWASIVLSFVILYLEGNDNYKRIANVIFIIVTAVYFILSNLTSLYLLRKAEDKRTTNLLANSFGITLDDELTSRYYNNNQRPSVTRLGMNIFENSFFSSSTTKVMLIQESFKIGMYLLVWLVLVLVRTTPIDLITVFSQTLLSTTIITNYIKLFMLSVGFSQIFNESRILFLNGIQQTALFEVQILRLFVRYESLKASMGLALSKKIFDKLNQKQTEEWERLKRNLNIS